MLCFTVECGGQLRGPSGTIDVLNITGSHEANQNCIWNVTVRPGRTILVKVVEMETLQHDLCVDSYVLVNCFL